VWASGCPATLCLSVSLKLACIRLRVLKNVPLFHHWHWIEINSLDVQLQFKSLCKTLACMTQMVEYEHSMFECVCWQHWSWVNIVQNIHETYLFPPFETPASFIINHLYCNQWEWRVFNVFGFSQCNDCFASARTYHACSLKCRQKSICENRPSSNTSNVSLCIISCHIFVPGITFSANAILFTVLIVMCALMCALNLLAARLHLLFCHCWLAVAHCRGILRNFQFVWLARAPKLIQYVM